MATPAQIAANRANGAKSTGPRTPEGKAKSRMNALSHGAWATTLERPELAQRREELREQLVSEWRPGSTVEIAIVNEMADTLLKLEQSPEVMGWAMQQLRRQKEVPEHVTDAQMIAVFFPTETSKLDLLERRQRNLSRQLSRLTRDLRQLQQDRAAADEAREGVEDEAGEAEGFAIADLRFVNEESEGRSESERTNPIVSEVIGASGVVPVVAQATTSPMLLEVGARLSA